MPPPPRRASARELFIMLAALAVLVAGVTAALVWRRAAPSTPSATSQPATRLEDDDDVLLRAPIKIAVGKVRPPLPYRVIAFHKHVDKRLIRLAAQLGFNGVQIQIEKTTVDGIKEFAKRDADDHIIDFCHGLGMQVTMWVHELNDVPQPWLPEWLGPVTTDNRALWSLLDDRYEWVLHDAVPNVDGLVLTVVETQIRATDTDVMAKLGTLIRGKCDKYHKAFVTRTFVWYPDEFEHVMAAVNRLPADAVVMSKNVPQDWQTRGTYAAEIGNVGGRAQIVEYDAFGEYFLRDHLANCMPASIKRHFDYGLGKKVSGVCVRVDQDEATLLHEPLEVNLWALGMLAAGATDDLDEVWDAWATNRYGKPAAAGVVRALKPAEEVCAELLSIGPFSFGDTRRFPPLGDEDVFGDNWQNWWWDKSYEPAHQQAEVGAASFTAEVAAAKDRARQEADRCLSELELVKEKLDPDDYAILRTKLVTNKAQLAFRAPMALAVLHYRQMMSADTAAGYEAADVALQADLADVRAAALPVYPPPREVHHLGKTWYVGPPEAVNREAVYRWAYQMDELRRGEDPRPPHRRGTLPQVPGPLPRTSP